MDAYIALMIQLCVGIAGVLIGMKIGLTRLDANYAHMSTQIEQFRKKLEGQVGQERCDKHRIEIEMRIEKRLDRLDNRLTELHNFVVTNFQTISVYMGRIERDC